MSYYFTNDPDRKENRRNITFRFLTFPETFISDDGVFSKNTLDFGSRLLLETVVNAEQGGRVLDLGCGIGYIGILFKKYHPDTQLTMADVNGTAVALAKENSRLYRQNNTCILSDGFNEIEGSFDVILTNPPIRTGKKTIYGLFDQSYEHLDSKGRLYVVIRKQQGAQSALAHLKQLSDNCEIIEKQNGYWIIRLVKD